MLQEAIAKEEEAAEKAKEEKKRKEELDAKEAEEHLFGEVIDVDVLQAVCDCPSPPPALCPLPAPAMLLTR